MPLRHQAVDVANGEDANDTAHNAPKGLLANAEICGQCHSRYSYTTQTFAVSPIPTPTASQTTLIQPQMALGGYTMLGQPAVAPATGWTPAAPLSDVPQRPVSGLVADSGSGRYFGRPRQAPDLLEGR